MILLPRFLKINLNFFLDSLLDSCFIEMSSTLKFNFPFKVIYPKYAVDKLCGLLLRAVISNPSLLRGGGTSKSLRPFVDPAARSSESVLATCER